LSLPKKRKNFFIFESEFKSAAGIRTSVLFSDKLPNGECAFPKNGE